MGTGEIALVISACMLICSVLTFIFARSSDHGKREYWEGQTTNKLDGIIDDLKDMKAQQRMTDKRILRDNPTRDVILERLGQIPELWRREVESELKHARFCDAQCERKYHAVIYGDSQGDGLRRFV